MLTDKQHDGLLALAEKVFFLRSWVFPCPMVCLSSVAWFGGQDRDLRGDRCWIRGLSFPWRGLLQPRPEMTLETPETFSSSRVADSLPCNLFCRVCWRVKSEAVAHWWPLCALEM